MIPIEILVVPSSREGRRQSALARPAGNIDIAGQLQLDQRAVHECIPFDEAVRRPRLSIDFDALHEDLSPCSILGIALEVGRANSRGCVQDGVPEGDLREVGRRDEELACSRQWVEAREIEGGVAAHRTRICTSESDQSI